MTDISKLGPEISQSYAKGLSISEEYHKRYKVPLAEAGFIREHTQVLDKTTRYPAIDILMGTYVKVTWAGFEPPIGYYTESSSHSLYVLSSPDQLDADNQRVLAVMREHSSSKNATESPSSDLPGQLILNLIAEASDYNRMVDDIIGLKNGFVKG